MSRQKFLFIITSVVGNILEWYDFALYGYFAALFATLFFPYESQAAALLFSFGVFASGNIVRPLGGAIFGYIGDRYGRRQALLLSIVFMTVPTVAIGLLPTYAALGWFAPLLLVACRFFQGVAVSGELTGSGTFLVESAVAKQRGFYASFAMSSTYLGLLVGAGVAMLVTLGFTPAAVQQYAWRLPFLLSFVFGVIALWLRMRCMESPMFLALLKNKQRAVNPLITSCRHHWRAMFAVAAASSTLAVGIYLLIGFLPSYLKSTQGFSLTASLQVSTLGLLCLTVAVPYCGRLCDRVGSRYLLTIAALLSIALSYPVFYLLGLHSMIADYLAELCIVLFLAPTAGSIMRVLTSAFPTAVRYSALSIGYNVSMTVLGGTTPIILQLLLTMTGSIAAGAVFVIACAVLTLLGVYALRQTEDQCAQAANALPVS